MSTVVDLEKRVASIEQELQSLRRQLPVPNWFSKFDGAFEGEPAFDDVIRYGREQREAEIASEDPNP